MDDQGTDKDQIHGIASGRFDRQNILISGFQEPMNLLNLLLKSQLKNIVVCPSHSGNLMLT